MLLIYLAQLVQLHPCLIAQTQEISISNKHNHQGVHNTVTTRTEHMFHYHDALS